MSFILHLAMGDVWNTINNTEKRYIASVIGVLLVWASAIHASRWYFTVLPL
jgi:tryptophan-rich sensory protein